MQTITCPLCDSPDTLPVANVHDRLIGLDGQFTLVCCAGCGLHYLNPQPTVAELARYYPENYMPFTTLLPAELPWLQRKSVNYGLRKRCRAVTRYKQSGQLLEVGCANGLFLNAMRQLGNWQLYGVDVSESAVRYARDRLGLDVVHGQLEDAQFPDNRFDVVVLWDVLEHVHRPRETLREICRVLKPNGVLVFRVPVLDSWDRKLFGPYWVGWDAPRHLTLFSMHTLGLMLAQTGFGVEQTACLSGGYPTFVLSVRFWAQAHLSEPAQKWLLRILNALPVRLLVGPFFYLIDRLGKSTVVTVVARPDNQTANCKRCEKT